jgi:hypothetical protein
VVVGCGAESDKMTTTTSPLPTQLYHYTSIRGVEGILTRKAVWASLLHFMNDSREWLYALDLVKASLHKKIIIRDDSHWVAFLADLIESLGRIEGLNICVFSLTAMPNQLSQWRAYCPPEGGYNLTFEPSLLAQHLDRHHFELRQCVYDWKEQEREIDRVVNKVLTAVGPLGDESQIESARETALLQFVGELSAVAPILKHPDFREEQEWRAFSLVPSNDPRMEYHIKGSVTIPHCVLDLQTVMLSFPISQVTVGPNAYQNLAMRGISALASGAGVSIAVVKSTTPLRNL